MTLCLLPHDKVDLLPNTATPVRRPGFQRGFLVARKHFLEVVVDTTGCKVSNDNSIECGFRRPLVLAALPPERSEGMGIS